MLSAQAVPTARYTPCVNALPLGWDDPRFQVEDGAASVQISRYGDAFVSASVTESCDISGAREVDSGLPDINRYEQVSLQDAEIRLVLVPSAIRPLLRARILAADLADVEIDDRPLVISIDDRVGGRVASRVDRALSEGQYVWIIDELIDEFDVAEQTVEMRGSTDAATARGATVDEALDHIEDTLPDVFYRGNWYFTFDGGCITYEFDATDLVAETIADDAAEAFGFYPAYELRQLAEEQGLDVGPADR